MLLVASNKIVASLLPVCCWIQRNTCCRDTGNMLPGNMLLVAGNMLLVRATCCLGVNVALGLFCLNLSRQKKLGPDLQRFLRRSYEKVTT